MYQWLVFLHAASVLVFLLAHGVSHNVALRLCSAGSADRVRALLEMSVQSYTVAFIALLFVLLLGIIAGIAGKWFSQGWIWAALILFIVLGVAMSGIRQSTYGPLRQALGMSSYGEPPKPASGAPLSDEQVVALAAATNPMPMIIVGLSGLAILLWLMIFKPF